MFDTILFPVNRTRETREAATLAIDLVKTYQSRLVLLSVVESDNKDGMGSEEEVAMLLAEAKALFAERGIQAETLEKEGIPAFVICDVADEINADLIVMGCRGMGLTNEGKSESVTTQAINLAPCPILVVP
jgi:nucleotide-binding universal stress UspA family protein